MPHSSGCVVRHTPSFVPVCGFAVSAFASDCLSEIQPGPMDGTAESSKPGLINRFCPVVDDAATTEGLAKRAVLIAFVSWLVTARPASTPSPNVTSMLPTVVQVCPSGEIAAITWFPVRVSRSHPPNDMVPPPRYDMLPPSATRAMNSTPPSGLISRTTRALDGDNAPIVTPALAYTWVFVSPRTCALTIPSPARGCVTAPNESAEPQMSEPAARTKKVPFETVPPPGVPTVPTSV